MALEASRDIPVVSPADPPNFRYKAKDRERIR